MIGLLLFAAGCSDGEEKNTGNEAQQEAVKPKIHLVISISDRLLHVLRNEDTVQTYPIAVGQSKYPTPMGEFKIHRIDWNPDWTPPDSKWSEDKSYTTPGHPNNPMGRARIVYQMPYTLHGTRDLQSLGEAESHGSVRMANQDVIQLAKLIMKESGSEKPDEWYRKVLSDSTKMVSVKLRYSISLTNKQ